MTIVDKAGAQQTSQAASTEPHTGNGRSSWSGPASVQSLLNERGETHGDFMESAEITQQLVKLMYSFHGVTHLNNSQLQALNMIFLKIGRILAGNPNFVDHWDDIAGYAQLIVREVRE